MKYNAYDLRKSGYRYLRGSSPYVEEAEKSFTRGILMPSGMAAISLLLQYLNPKSIWYPYDLYQGTYELISLLKIPVDNKKPDIVIYDNPSFSGNIKPAMPKFKNKPIIIVDNSVMPDQQSFKSKDYDYLVTSLSKYHTNCETVLGLITIGSKTLKKAPSLREELAELRWKSGYTIFRSQCNSLKDHFRETKKKSFEKFLTDKAEKAKKLGALLKSEGFDTVVSGALVFVIMPDYNTSAEEIARKTSFDLRPTYGADKTFISYSYCQDNYRYFSDIHKSGEFIRISPGEDYTTKEIAAQIKKAMQKQSEKIQNN